MLVSIRKHTWIAYKKTLRCKDVAVLSCDQCQKVFERDVRALRYNKNHFCCNECKHLAQRRGNLTHSEFTSQRDFHVGYEKCKQTCIERHGVEHILQVPEIRDRIDATNLERYGGTNVMHSKMCKNVKDKHVDYPFQSTQFKEKAKETFLENYGVDHCLKSPIIVLP